MNRSFNKRILLYLYSFLMENVDRKMDLTPEVGFEGGNT